MKNSLPWFRKLQKRTMTATGTLSTEASKVAGLALNGLTRLDNQFAITPKARAAGERVEAVARELDRQYDLSGKTRKTKEIISDTQEHIRESGRVVAQASGLAGGGLGSQGARCRSSSPCNRESWY